MQINHMNNGFNMSNFNPGFNNNFNAMNPHMNYNANFNFTNNAMFNYNLMMNNNIMQNNNQKILMMQNMINQQKQQNFQKKIMEILNAHEKKEEEKEEVILTEEERKAKEEKEKREKALEDVIREQIEHEQNFENLQPPNLDYHEVDPEFMHSFISDEELFCGSGHNLIGKWAHNENRGGRPYNPPEGWIGFGLNVINKYDNENNDWLACDGRPGEWCVAFHGACVRNTSEQIKQIIKPILQNNLKPGGGQAYAGYDDACHPGNKVGVGVYCSPDPNVMDGYAGKITVNGFAYKVGFMLRVKPDKIRYSSSCPSYWVLNAGDGNFSEMRPYRFLIKKV